MPLESPSSTGIDREDAVLPATIRALVENAARVHPEATALLAPGREPLTYARLLKNIEQAESALNAVGIGRGDRVATVLPNGPEIAAAFLSVSSAAACAPLNPSYRGAEFDFYLGDLQPRALIVAAGAESPVIAVAAARKIPLIRLAFDAAEPAGSFRLEHELPAAEAALPGKARPEDVALLLHTSGTTSRPKLVPLSNANLCRSAANIRRALQLKGADRCLNIMPLFHIHGLAAAVLASLAARASIVCTPGFLAPAFFDWVAEFRPTWYTAVPTMHQAILERAAEHRGVIESCPLRLIRSCSSALPPQVMLELERVFEVPVIESYGMTEAAHQMASNPLPPARRKPGSVGLPAGPEVAIIDDAARFLTAGARGEVVIRGENVTSGYAANPQANAAAFSDGWFRTGDQGYLDEDGYLFLTGRTKEMINRGGEKISPREIDEVLMDHPAVAHALAFAMPDPRLGEEVAAAVVLRSGSDAGEYELREFAGARLAVFKVPRKIVFLPEIPKGPTGKPQRIGLAEKLGIVPEPEAPKAAPFVAPRNDTERTVSAIWRQVLRRERVGVCDAFFESGGDSVLAAQVLARIAEETGWEMPVLAFFAAPTVEGVAAWLDAARGRHARSGGPGIEPSDRSGVMPLSFSQERLWFLSRLEGNHAPFLRPAAFRLRGPLNADALRAALNGVLARHEALRTSFQSRGAVAVQMVRPATDLPLEVTDLSTLPEQERIERAQRLAREQLSRPWDLASGTMVQASLLKLADEDHVLLVTMHHIASDGWSGRVFLRELAALYGGAVEGREADLPPLPVQYGDYARWQRERTAGGEFERQLEYWKRRLDGAPDLLALPADRPRPQRQTYRGARTTLEIPYETRHALESIARRDQATLFMTLLAAFQALLHRYSGSDDVVVGCPVANRTRMETEPLIGCFVNTLVMRTDLSGEPRFRDLLGRVRANCLADYAHQEMPFEKLVEALQPARSLAYSPLFQVMFQLRNLPFEAPEFDGIQIEPLEFDPGVTQFDLAVDIQESGRGLVCVLDYSTDLFERETAERILGHFRTLLEAVAANPDARISELPLLTAAERAVRARWNQTRCEWPDSRSLIELFEARTTQMPDSVAAFTPSGDRVTYGDLDRDSAAIAATVANAGGGRGTVVGVCLERSPRAIAAILGVLRAGAAYLPLDPGYPPERLAFMLDDSRAPLLLTERRHLAALPGSLPRTILLDDPLPGAGGSARQVRSDADDPAYVVYTSGSTGTPKGVIGLHRGLLNRLRWGWATYPFEAGEVCCNKTPLSFVDSVAEIFSPLLAGIPFAILGDGLVKGSPPGFLDQLERLRVTRIVLVPSVIRSLLDVVEGRDRALPDLRLCVSSGETLPAELAAGFLRLLPHVRLLNLYGSSEVAADATFHEVRPGADGPVPIGRPIANAQVYLLDRRMEPVPAGVPGELYVGGECLGGGYLYRPELTAGRFVDSPFERGAKLFRTGDIARCTSEGVLEYLGRVDDQVKIRGCRVEPDEVEAALLRHPQVHSAAVAARAGSRGEAELAAWVVPANGAAPAARDLRRFLAGRVPAYAVPSRFAVVDALPLLPNGKVNRRALPENAASLELRVRPEPRDETERRLTALFQESLGTAAVGPEDDFFDLGGHSLLAARLAARIEQEFGRPFPISALFESPTPAGAAAAIRRGPRASYPPGILPVRPAGSRTPLFIAGGIAHLQGLIPLTGEDQPVYVVSLQESEIHGLKPPYSLPAIATRMVHSLREYRASGPYLLAGYSLLGLYAFEMARQLAASGDDVRNLILLDTSLPRTYRAATPAGTRAVRHLGYVVKQALEGNPREIAAHAVRIAAMVREQARQARPAAEAVPVPTAPRRAASMWEVLRAAAASYTPAPYRGRVTFFEAGHQYMPLEFGSRFGWDGLAGSGLKVITVPGNHSQMLDPPNLELLARELRSCLEGGT